MVHGQQPPPDQVQAAWEFVEAMKDSKLGTAISKAVAPLVEGGKGILFTSRGDVVTTSVSVDTGTGTPAVRLTKPADVEWELLALVVVSADGEPLFRKVFPEGFSVFGGDLMVELR